MKMALLGPAFLHFRYPSCVVSYASLPMENDSHRGMLMLPTLPGTPSQLQFLFWLASVESNMEGGRNKGKAHLIAMFSSHKDMPSLLPLLLCILSVEKGEKKGKLCFYFLFSYLLTPIQFSASILSSSPVSPIYKEVMRKKCRNCVKCKRRSAHQYRI